MGTLASLVARNEQPIVRAHAARLQRAAREQEWPGARPAGLRRRVCFVVAAIAPTLPPQRLSILARYALWSFVFDDAIDASGLDPGALARIRDAVFRITTGGRAATGDLIQVGLARMLDDLSPLDRTGELVRRFGEALRDAASAEVEQVLLGRAVAAGTAAPPAAEEYLGLAARTANYRSFAFGLLAVVDGSLPTSILDRMDPALWHASRAVRLGNDLRSVARDRSSSGLNIVDLRTAGGEPVTRQRVVADIDRHVRAHDRALAPLAGAGAEAAVPALRRSLRVTVDAFRIRELR
jgi:terpene synthase-like protein